MKRPKKQVATGPVPCRKCGGTGWRYHSYTCTHCCGRGKRPTEEVQQELDRQYEQELEKYRAWKQLDKVLSTIKLTKEQAEALDSYGVRPFLNTYGPSLPSTA